MSWSHINAIRELELPPVDKLVLYAIASRANGQGECWPSIDTLAKDAGLARRTVQYHLSALMDSGMVSRVERRGATALLRLHIGTADTGAGDAHMHAAAQQAHGVHPPVHPTAAQHALHAPEVRSKQPLNLQEQEPARDISTTDARDDQQTVVNDTARAPSGWWMTQTGIDRRGRELNVLPRPGEGYADYKQRLFEADQARRRASQRQRDP
jgi:DNA-binding transcriptional ArsR family regulator